MSEQKWKAESASKQAAAEEQTEAEEWLSTREVCSYLGISRRTLQNWVNKGVVSFSQVHTPNGIANRYKKADLEGLKRDTPATSQAIVGSFAEGEMAGKIFAFLERLEPLETIGNKLDTLIAQQEHLARTQEVLAIEQRRANDLKESELALERQRLEIQRRGFRERLLSLGGLIQDKVQTQTNESSEAPAVESERNEGGSAVQTSILSACDAQAGKRANGAATTLVAQTKAHNSSIRQGQGPKRFVIQLLKLAVKLLERAKI